MNLFQGLLFAGFEEIGQRGAVRTMRFLFLVRLNFEQVGLDRFFEKSAPSWGLSLWQSDPGIGSGSASG